MDRPADVERLSSLDPLISRLRALGEGGRRVMVGLAGAPGAGKSTLAQALVDRLEAGSAAVVSMDGFHLAAEVIAGTELQARRGAIDTYDADGFLHLLRRLRSADEAVVHAPRYAREIEDPIAAAISVPGHIRYIVVEGNYLLAEPPVWRSARAQLDEVWFIDVASELRLSRLVERHVAFGKSRDQALLWSHGSDEVNARLIDAGRAFADLVINVEDLALLDRD
ncbi:nucleoside/nucleotide kinase family protein [Phytohabitans kaempferiae]|uniref:Nucleoside/nucleotide kinase family protein n=1 Tax=Phytohabitans kaempferiae TaxID=1620943 RepID=A0ABV6M2X8_9ACTN